MMQLELPELEDSGMDDADDECLCDTTELGCFEHFEGSND